MEKDKFLCHAIQLVEVRRLAVCYLKHKTRWYVLFSIKIWTLEMNLSLNINSLSKNYYVSEDDKMIEDGIAEGWYTTCLKKTAIWIELLTNTFLIPFLLFQLFVGLSFYVPFQNSKTCSIKMCDSFCSIDNRSTIVLCFHLHQLGRCVSNFWNSVYKTVDINISVLCFCLVSPLSNIFKWKVVFPVEKTQPKHDILMKWKVFES